jgi:hypothetical protein
MPAICCVESPRCCTAVAAVAAAAGIATAVAAVAAVAAAAEIANLHAVAAVAAAAGIASVSVCYLLEIDTTMPPPVHDVAAAAEAVAEAARSLPLERAVGSYACRLALKGRKLEFAPSCPPTPIRA